MTERTIDQSAVLESRLKSMDRQELCRLVIRLCDALMEQGGAALYHGGVYPENINLRPGESPVIGSGHMSGWQGQELQFIPPELYWDGKASPRGDVYALGLLLYYGVTGGRLPLEGESPDPQLSRMSGAAFSAPDGAGIRLGEIITKAMSFQPEDRYANAGELKVNLESCLTNKYVTDRASEELFRKEEPNLSDAERMMLDIISGVPAKSGTGEPPVSETVREPAPELSREESEELILGALAPETEELDLEAERRALMEEVFGTPEPEPEEEESPETPAAAETPEEEAVLPEIQAVAQTEPPPEEPLPAAPVEDDEAEDVRVYEPAREKKEQREHIPIPILTEEKNPELSPITIEHRPVRYTKDPERDEQIAKQVRKRRTQPIGVVLILCGLLIFAALIANHMLQSYEYADEGRGRSFAMPDVGEDAIASSESFISVEELERQEESISHQSYYQIFIGDMSWTDAKNACTELGGQLAVINTQDEFTMVTQLAQQSGVQGIWVGCHRENDYLQWEKQESVGMMNWAENEPSYIDSRDHAAEDYIMLWNTGNGWAYIDCRNDPVRADPTIYRGVIGYVCEFENNG